MAIHTLTPEEKKARLDPLAGLRLYSLAEVEDVLGVSHRTLQTYVKEGHIQARKVGGRWKVTKEEIDRIIAEGTRDTGAKRKKPAGNKKKPKAE